MNYKLSKYLVTTDVLDPDGQDPQRILFSTRTGASFLINTSNYKKLIDGSYNELEFNTLSRLLEYEILVLEEEDEFREIMALNRIGLKDQKTLSPIIQTTANCQLGCHYCGQIHSKNTMTNEIVEKMINRIESKVESRNYEILNVTWYGGEPLLGYSSILNISERLKHIAAKNKMLYTGYIITNGLSLKPNIFKELYLNHSVNRFQITLDTVKEKHDVRRITKDGNSTFDIIFNNLLKITNEPYYRERINKPILVRMNIDVTNYKDVISFIDYLCEFNLQDKIDINFSPIVNWGQETAGDDFALTKEQFAELEIEWYLYAMNKGFSFGYFLPTRDYSSCMVVMDGAEVYDAFGNILPCYEFSYTPYYDSKEYKIGNLLNDESTYDNNIEIRRWYDILEAGEKSYCSKCNLLPVCNGACPKKWLKGEIGCPEFKLNIEDRLIMQYLMNKSNMKELL